MTPNSDIYDIMDRYLDHVSTPEEEQELFRALLRDEELNTAFQAQQQISSTVQSDAASIMVPPDLYASIVEQAQRAALLPVPVMGAAGIAAEWVGRTLINIAMATTSATMAVVTMHAVSAITASEPPVPPSRPAVTHHADHQAPAPMSTMAPPVSPSPERERVAEARPSIGDHETSVAHTTNNAAPTVVPVTAEETVSAITNAPFDDAKNTLVIRPAIVSTQADATALASLSSAYDSPLAPTATPLPVHVRITQVPITHYMYATNTQLTWQQNIGIEAEYIATAEHAVGLAVHNDVFPVVVVGADSSMQSKYTMMWAGASYRYTPDVQLPLNAQPFAQITVGGSSRGAVTQPTLGLQFTAGQLSFSAGATMTNLFYQNQGSWGVVSRVGMLVGIGLHL